MSELLDNRLIASVLPTLKMERSCRWSLSLSHRTSLENLSRRSTSLSTKRFASASSAYSQKVKTFILKNLTLRRPRHNEGVFYCRHSNVHVPSIWGLPFNKHFICDSLTPWQCLLPEKSSKLGGSSLEIGISNSNAMQCNAMRMNLQFCNQTTASAKSSNMMIDQAAACYHSFDLIL